MLDQNIEVVFDLPDGSFRLATPVRGVSPVIVNWLMLRTCIIDGAKKYLNNDVNTENRYGRLHGADGQRRASWAHRVESLINDFDTTLIVALVIFGPPTEQNFFEWKIGRSSALASCIADLCITGEQELKRFYKGSIETLHSEVFSPDSLQDVVYMSSCDHAATFSFYSDNTYFDKTKGIRVLLKAALEAMPPAQADHTKNKVLYLKNIFENTSCKNKTDEEIIELTGNMSGPT